MALSPDLRAYVLAGKAFPRTATDFQTMIPKSAFSSLLTIDPLIYDQTRDTMTAISSFCATYHTQRLGKLVTVATSVQYVSTSIRHPVDLSDMNLKDNLNIMLDSKYTDSATFDADCIDARACAKDTLTNLKKIALARTIEVDSAINALTAFKDDTSNQLANVNYLKKRYRTGPVTNNSTVKTPHLEWLNAELNAELNADLALAWQEGLWQARALRCLFSRWVSAVQGLMQESAWLPEEQRPGQLKMGDGGVG
ncbi:hypothetical protein B0T14DRAFT_565035 [Immersiella caudata]|uniref:Uncharacterized protein n=1 Tax=Immersiella caudata TaxID=314043 RepID=A0AA40C379_9PEZI|nr:hypothetical protein B0T14DRAFT_565035 [Immersiella caudata]